MVQRAAWGHEHEFDRVSTSDELAPRVPAYHVGNGGHVPVVGAVRLPIRAKSNPDAPLGGCAVSLRCVGPDGDAAGEVCFQLCLRVARA